MSQTDEHESTAHALQDWRQAQQVAAVAHRGREAARLAAAAAEQAAEAAIATAEAAKSALASAILAEGSAQRTADAARLFLASTGADLADGDAEARAADAAETAAHERYQRAYDRAAAKG